MINENKENFVISVNHESQSLQITKDVNSSDLIGPYLAMYLYKYRKYKWLNWLAKESPSLLFLQNNTKYLSWETYIYSVIVEKGTTFEQMKAITKKLGYIPDYFLEREFGKVELLHQTDYINSLIEKGYILNDIEHGEGNYSFGRGVYCLDKANFTNINSDWIKQSNVYVGIYEGEYLRCIDDVHNADKCGFNSSYQQEIVIPFAEKNIKWLIK